MSATSRYFFFFTLQTIGAGILFLYAIPLYRQVLADPGGHVVRNERLIWSLSSIGLMQTAYWLRHRLNSPLPRFRNALIGHIILFIGRLSFIFSSAVFGFAFLVHRPELQIPFSRYVVLILGLFALFCYVQELERLGRALSESKDGS
jgi:hypothetical protein